MNLKLITLSGIMLDADIYQVNIPTPDGEIAVYPRVVHYLHHFVLACHLVGLSLLRKRSASPFGCSFCCHNSEINLVKRCSVQVGCTDLLRLNNHDTGFS